jgi:hypothetical protein
MLGGRERRRTQAAGFSEPKRRRGRARLKRPPDRTTMVPSLGEEGGK